MAHDESRSGPERPHQPIPQPEAQVAASLARAVAEAVRVSHGDEGRPTPALRAAVHEASAAARAAGLSPARLHAALDAACRAAGLPPDDEACALAAGLLLRAHMDGPGRDA